MKILLDECTPRLVKKRLPHQQNLSGKKIMVIILPSNKIPVVAQLISAVEQSLQKIQPGTFVEIPLP